MRYFYSFILAAILVNTVAAAVPDSTNASLPLDRNRGSGRCQCFVVSGPEPGYFQNYRFYDFRSLRLGPEPKDNLMFAPDSLPEGIGSGQSSNSDEVPLTKGDWASQEWHRNGSRLFPVPIQNSARNVFISQDEAAGTEGATYLTMRTMRHQDFSSTAEIVSRMKNILHASVRVRLRLLSGTGRVHPRSDTDGLKEPVVKQPRQQPLPPPPGAVTGLFTYHSFTSESDIEILTGDPPTQVRYVNQPSYDPIADTVIPGAGIVANIPAPWTEWATHRLDWLPGMSRWFVNSLEQATNTYGVPHDPSMLVLNLWSDGGIWSGNLTVGEAVHLGIEWIEIAYNTSGPVEGPGNGKSRGELNNTLNLNLAEEEDTVTTTSPHPTEDASKRAAPLTTAARSGCQVGCTIDNDDGPEAKKLAIPKIAWDHRPHTPTTDPIFDFHYSPFQSPYRYRYPGLYRYGNPYPLIPHVPAVAESGGGISIRIHLSGACAVLLRVAGAVGVLFLFSYLICTG